MADGFSGNLLKIGLSKQFQRKHCVSLNHYTGSLQSNKIPMKYNGKCVQLHMKVKEERYRTGLSLKKKHLIVHALQLSATKGFGCEMNGGSFRKFVLFRSSRIE